jgi:HEPN domain-containing protein
MNTDKVSYWIEIAEYDLETAKAMLTTGRYLYVGFMCHQAIEKALKAHIAKTDIFPPKIHKLDRLAELAGLATAFDKQQQELIDRLTPLNVESRYPEHKEAIAAKLNESACKSIIVQTEEMLSWIKNKL